MHAYGIIFCMKLTFLFKLSNIHSLHIIQIARWHNNFICALYSFDGSILLTSIYIHTHTYIYTILLICDKRRVIIKHWFILLLTMFMLLSKLQWQPHIPFVVLFMYIPLYIHYYIKIYLNIFRIKNWIVILYIAP